MSIFSNFTDTIFLKNDNSLEKQVEDLNKLPKNEKIAKDLYLLELGIKGENAIAFELQNANLGLYVLKDVTIKCDNTKAQIDFVVVSKRYTYLIECKNLIGNIFVNSSGQFQREYELKGKKFQEAIYSPYTQATRHKEILKKIWQKKANFIDRILFDDRFDSTYKPLVVLANSKSILNTKFAPKEVKENTIRVDQLIEYIKRDLNKEELLYYSSKNAMEKTANSVLNLCCNDNYSIANNYIINDNIKYKLVEFRKEKSKKMNIPAYYIFTNKELDNLLLIKPKNITQLEKILDSVKVKCHGKEILDIINNVK